MNVETGTKVAIGVAGTAAVVGLGYLAFRGKAQSPPDLPAIPPNAAPVFTTPQEIQKAGVQFLQSSTATTATGGRLYQDSATPPIAISPPGSPITVNKATAPLISSPPGRIL